jgi:hypothetical protein
MAIFAHPRGIWAENPIPRPYPKSTMPSDSQYFNAVLNWWFSQRKTNTSARTVETHEEYLFKNTNAYTL